MKSVQTLHTAQYVQNKHCEQVWRAEHVIIIICDKLLYSACIWAIIASEYEHVAQE